MPEQNFIAENVKLKSGRQFAKCKSLSSRLFLFDLNGQENAFMIALVISLTLVGTIIMAKLVGSSLPLLASKVGFDPAVMANPLISTVCDSLSLLIYFGVAKLILHL